MSANNFETYQEFNETSFDLINKMNIITTALNSDGYDNVIVNPQVNNIFLNDKSYTIPDNSPALTRFGFSGWVHSVSGNNTNKCVRLNTIVPSTLSTYNELKNTKLFKLNLKSDMNIYTDANIRIDANAIYVFAVEYNVVEGSVVDKDLNLNSLKYYNTLTSNFEPISFNSTTDKFTISNIKTVINNKNNFVKYYYIKSNNYFEQNALFRFELSATSTNNTTFIQIYSTNFYKGDILLNGLTNNSINNLVKTVDGVVSVSDNGIDYNPIVNSNVVTVGARGAKYTDLITAINSEAVGTVFEVISNITILSTSSITKSNNIINGNNFTISTSSTFNIGGTNNTFNNCDFNFNDIQTGISITGTSHNFNNCEFRNTRLIGINITGVDHIFNNIKTSNMVRTSVNLSGCNNSIFHFKNLNNFYYDSGVGIGLNLSGCNNNIIRIDSSYNISDGEDFNVGEYLVKLTNSNTNSIKIESFSSYFTQQLVKLTNSANNKVSINNVDIPSDKVSTDNILPNYIQSYQTQISTNTKLPQQLYSYCINNNMISENELSLQSLSAGGWFQGDYLRISDNGHNSKQSLKVSNAIDKTYIRVFGENSPNIFTSNPVNENMYFVNDALTAMKSFNVLADTTNITSSIINLNGDVKANSLSNLSGTNLNLTSQNINLNGIVKAENITTSGTQNITAPTTNITSQNLNITVPTTNITGQNLNIKSDITIIPDHPTPQPDDYGFINCAHNLHIKTRSNGVLLLGYSDSSYQTNQVINRGFTRLGDGLFFKMVETISELFEFSALETRTLIFPSTLDNNILNNTIDISATVKISVGGTLERVAKITDFYIDYASKEVILTYTNPMNHQVLIQIFVTTRYAAPF